MTHHDFSCFSWSKSWECSKRTWNTFQMGCSKCWSNCTTLFCCGFKTTILEIIHNWCGISFSSKCNWCVISTVAAASDIFIAGTESCSSTDACCIDFAIIGDVYFKEIFVSWTAEITFANAALSISAFETGNDTIKIVMINFSSISYN